MKQSLVRSDLALRRIAETLGVSPESFAQGGEPLETAFAQSTALLNAFLEIRSPELRGKCLTFVKQAAASSTSDPS